MRVLVLDEWLPVPPDSGKRLRSYELLRRLAGRHQLTWLAPARPGPAAAAARARMEADGFRVETVDLAVPGRGDAAFYLRAAASLFSREPYVVSRYHSARLTRRLEELHRAGPFDLLHVEWTPLAANLPRGWDRPWLGDAHNPEWRNWERHARVARAPHLRAFYALEARRMARYERATFRAAGLVLAVSEPEQREIEALGGRARCVDNGVDLERLRPGGGPEAPALLFTGALDWEANLDAVAHFTADLWPAVRAACPQLRFQVVGARPAPGWQARTAACPGVEVHATVPDIRPYFERAAVVVVPLRVGGGTRLKILEALAMEKAVVSTGVGAEGLALVEGEDYLRAETPAEWAAAVSRLMRDPALRRRLGASGRRRIEGRYGWDTLAAAVERAWLELVERRAAS
ncbi:MAG TPA: glycosyltransferase family 4 protein [Candidatus Saccharimonadales bacterium]|nr:glycosyltransferase family 4 protein [Candidatus Saccharimonadales bacterium]